MLTRCAAGWTTIIGAPVETVVRLLSGAKSNRQKGYGARKLNRPRCARDIEL